jgi:hypothetical protein
MRLFACLRRARKVRPWRLAFEPEGEFERQLFVRDLRAAPAVPVPSVR